MSQPSAESFVEANSSGLSDSSLLAALQRRSTPKLNSSCESGSEATNIKSKVLSPVENSQNISQCQKEDNTPSPQLQKSPLVNGANTPPFSPDSKTPARFQIKKKVLSPQSQVVSPESKVVSPDRPLTILEKMARLKEMQNQRKKV